MAAALSVPDEVEIGEAIEVTGTGWGVADVTLTVSNPEESEELSVVLSPSTGAITTAGVIDFAPTVDGIWKFSATDGTDTVEAQTKVSSAG